MSKNEYEYGKYKLPSADFSAFKKELVTCYNNTQLEYFKIANEIHEKLLTEYKEQIKTILKTVKNDPDNRNYNRVLIGAVDSICWREMERRKKSYEDVQNVVELLISRKENERVKIKKPKKSDMKLAKNDVTHISDGEFYIYFKKPEVSYDIPEGNRSVEIASQTKLYKTFESALKKIKWTRNTGGCGHYDDEYSQDADRENHYSHRTRIVGALGPIGEFEHAHNSGLSMKEYQKIYKKAKAPKY